MMTAAPICVNIVWEDVCDCAGHTRDENCSCTSFHSVAHLEVIPCPSYGSPGPEAPTPNTPNNPIPNDPNGGSSGNSNDIGEVSLDPVLPTISKKPCKDLADLSKPNSGDIKPELDWLKTKLNETKEFGVEFEKKLNYNGDIVYPKTEKESDESNHVELSYGGNVIGAAHSHPANITFAIPSYGDLKWLEILLSNTPPFRQKDVFTMIVCKDKAGTISTYAIKITSFSEFTAKINEIWDSSKYSGKSKEQKLDAINDLQKIECSKTNGQYDQLEKSFLEMYAGFGFDILKATDDNLDNWETLKLDNTQPSGVKSIPCTNN